MKELVAGNKTDVEFGKNIVSSFDFVAKLKINELMKECRIESRFDIAEVVSNLSRTLSNYDVKKEDLDKIEIGVDRAISGGGSLTTIRLSEGEKQRVKEAIMSRIKALIIT